MFRYKVCVPCRTFSETIVSQNRPCYNRFNRSNPKGDKRMETILQVWLSIWLYVMAGIGLILTYLIWKNRKKTECEFAFFF